VSATLATNGSEIAEGGGDFGGTTKVQPPMEAEKAAILAISCWPQSRLRLQSAFEFSEPLGRNKKAKGVMK